MPIEPDRILALRNRKGMSRRELARVSRISLRQLSRLEDNSTPSVKPHENTVLRLAKALSVDPGVLTGELPMPKSVSAARPAPGERVQVSALLMPEVRLAYALIKRRYGVNPTTLFNVAPLLFVLLAEASHLWRREKLEEIKEAADRLAEMGRGAGHLRFAFAACRIDESIPSEEQSISNCDLFGKDIGEDAYNHGYDPTMNNPFADYLREFAGEIDDQHVDVDGDYLDVGVLEGFPHYRVCRGELDSIAGGSEKAAWALERGHARLGDIPDELLADSAAERRMRWLEEKVPESESAIFDIDLSSLMSPEAGGNEANP